MLRWRAPFVASILVACSSSSTQAPAPASDASTTVPEPTEPVDAGADTAPETEAPIVVGDCTVKRVANPDSCDEPCDARLLLPSKNGSYCTIACEKDSDCGGKLKCPETVGACMPPCTSDATCKAAGFARCDAKTGACDTI